MLDPATAEPHAGTSPDESAFPLIDGLHWVVANLAERAPLLIAVDDALWSDELSLRFLDYLALRRACRQPRPGRGHRRRGSVGDRARRRRTQGRGVKAYREHSGAGLKKAKRAVDRLEALHGPDR